MWIELRTPRSRARCGRLDVRAEPGEASLRPPCPALAGADPEIAAGLDNPGNDPLRPGGPPPFGRYRLSQVVPTRSLAREVQAEYGPVVLAFEPLAGDALVAESYGRLLLLVHGGDSGADGRLRPTTGGVRLSDADVRAVAELVRDLRPDEVMFEVRPLFFLWALGQPRPSRTGARPVAAPLAAWGLARRPPEEPAGEADESWRYWDRTPYAEPHEPTPAAGAMAAGVVLGAAAAETGPAGDTPDAGEHGAAAEDEGGSPGTAY